MPSSVISSTDFDAATRKLRVYFVSGAVYDYSKVPATLVRKMELAPSKGKFFNRFIKDHYAYRKVE
jgi:KTSC domain